MPSALTRLHARSITSASTAGSFMPNTSTSSWWNWRIAALLRPLVPEHRAERVELRRGHRLLEAVLDERAHHARRRFRPQRHAVAALVGERVHLLLDDVGGLARALGEQFLALDDRRADLDVAVALAERAGDALDVLPLLDLARQDVVRAADSGIICAG